MTTGFIKDGLLSKLLVTQFFAWSLNKRGSVIARL